MKTDARIRYTKMVIKNSFMELLKKQSVNKITVKEVCDLAEINRATFYTHYTDCFDLMKQIEDEMITELQQLVGQSAHKSVTDIFKKIFIKLKEDSAFYLTLVSANGDSTFPNRILNLCYEQMFPSFETQFPNMPKHRREWFYYFSASGCSGILSHWIGTGMEEDVAELAAFTGDLLNRINNAFNEPAARRL